MEHGPLVGVRRLRRTAERAPDHRDRYVDLLRAFAISAVVLGHWLAVVVVRTPEGGITGENALVHIPWAHPLTWLLQVMPIFFLVGGYANAASLTSHYRRGGGTAGWLLGRTDRLMRPTTALLVALAVFALAGRALGLDEEDIGLAVWAALIPLWFLAAYISVVFLTPLMYALHRRAGLAVPAALTAAVLLIDTARIGFGVPVIGEANFLLVWLTVHQLGFAWRDGRLPRHPVPFALLGAGGTALLLALTMFGPYPVSMVSVPGEELQNASPPTFALLTLAYTQTAVVLLLSGPANRMLRRIGPWTAVVGVNTVVLTLFLWHMVAAVIAAAVLFPTEIFPQVPVGSAEWLLLRVPWVLVVAVVLTVLVAVFGRIEVRSGSTSAVAGSAGERPDPWRSPPVWLRWGLIVFGGVAVVTGLLVTGIEGPGYHGPVAMPTVSFLGYLLGAAALRAARERLTG
ncbi:acyltransferase family protein [Allosalinactinospora lopnorensis]|uniref:acyltransferase family protein n=1 Tax=Allosalinactinospora lopnorensis TaxID=1352348 RepID=UPI000A96E3E8|nr:acyltransferase [Allosalinactinospora lopnorensis]